MEKLDLGGLCAKSASPSGSQCCGKQSRCLLLVSSKGLKKASSEDANCLVALKFGCFRHEVAIASPQFISQENRFLSANPFAESHFVRVLDLLSSVWSPCECKPQNRQGLSWSIFSFVWFSSGIVPIEKIQGRRVITVAKAKGNMKDIIS